VGQPEVSPTQNFGINNLIMSNFAYLVEQDIEKLDDQTLKQILGCCYDQNKTGPRIARDYEKSDSRDYQKMGAYIRQDMENNKKAIGIIKNLLGI
jgi:hypothetical protein